NSKHRHETRSSSSGNYNVQTSRLNLNQDSFSRFGAKLWNAIPNEFRQLSKGAFKRNFHDFLLSIMEAEDDYVEVPILLQKMANSASSTQLVLIYPDSVEKKNDDLWRYFQWKINHWDAATHLLLVEKRQEELRGQERKKRTYTKQKSLFWLEGVKQESAKKGCKDFNHTSNIKFHC
ncbi:hypothetical protein pdam_00025191, partial [Pocillopora damicornis]